jgi:hypothetical protein
MTETRLEDGPRMERLIALAERLVVALEADIAALKAGKPAEMKSMDPEIQKLSVIYGREAQNFDIRIAKSAPPDTIDWMLATALLGSLPRNDRARL